jgi:hypothetical protein
LLFWPWITLPSGGFFSLGPGFVPEPTLFIAPTVFGAPACSPPARFFVVLSVFELLSCAPCVPWLFTVVPTAQREGTAVTYTVEQLAPGSYDVLLDGVTIAGLVRVVSGSGPSDTWQIELLDEMPETERPAPFTSQWHTFKSRSAALEWLGIRKERVPDAPTG